VSSDSALDDLSASDRERLLAGFRDSSLCRSRRDRRTSLASTEVEYPYQVSSAGMAVIDSILTEIDDIADLYAKNADTLAA
jgi:hypothetical protein